MFVKCFGACLLALSMTTAASAATIFSDDFEKPANSKDWQVYQDFASWSTTEGTGIEIQRDDAIGVTAKSGRQYVELDSDSERGGDGSAGSTNSSMTTKLNLAGGSYRLDWYYRPRTNTPNDNTISVYLAGVGEGLLTRFLGTMNKTTSQSNDWELVSYFFNVKGSDGPFALTFRAEGNPNELGGFIDDVKVAAVPVPAAGFLLLGAIGGLVALRRRKSVA